MSFLCIILTNFGNTFYASLSDRRFSSLTGLAESCGRTRPVASLRADPLRSHPPLSGRILFRIHFANYSGLRFPRSRQLKALFKWSWLFGPLLIVITRRWLNWQASVSRRFYQRAFYQIWNARESGSSSQSYGSYLRADKPQTPRSD